MTLWAVFFGAFVLALIKLIRLVVAYLDRQTRRAQEGNLMLKLAVKGTRHNRSDPPPCQQPPIEPQTPQQNMVF